MRLLVKLCSKINYKYDTENNYHLQGFIYNLIKCSKYHFLHDKKGYKYFCFSDIFPFSSLIRKDDIKNWIISSPDNEFVLYLDSLLNKCQNKYLQVGNMEFVTLSMRDAMIPVYHISQRLTQILILSLESNFHSYHRV